MQSANPAVVLVDVPADNHTLALRSIELIHQELSRAAIFAVGSMSQPQVIVSAMRAGAREYIERPTTTNELLEAFITADHGATKSGPRRTARKSFYRGQRQRRQRSHHHSRESGAGVAIRPRRTWPWWISRRSATPRCT